MVKAEQSGGSNGTPESGDNSVEDLTPKGVATNGADQNQTQDTGQDDDLRRQYRRLEQLYEEIVIAQRESATIKAQIEERLAQVDRAAIRNGPERQPVEQEQVTGEIRSALACSSNSRESGEATAKIAGAGHSSSSSSSLRKSEYELPDVSPASIADYMDRLLKRSNRSAQAAGKGRCSVALPAAIDFSPPKLDRCFVESGSSEFETAAPSPNLSRPRRPTAGPAEVRTHLEGLRSVAVASTRNALVQHIRRRHRLMITRQLLLIFVAFGLASALYAAHYVLLIPLRHLAWCATATGLVSILGMTHLWSQAARQQKRLHARVRIPAFRASNAEVGPQTDRPSVV